MSDHIPSSIKFLFGGLSGMGATCVVQPLDLIKNRMQLMGKAGQPSVGFIEVVRRVVQNEGVLGIYAGLSAGLLRQATYTTTRLGVYNTLTEKVEEYYRQDTGGKVALSLTTRGLIGMASGGFAAVIGTPAELALIRMSADGLLPPEQRRGYTNVFNAISRIAKEEGVLKLWRGCQPTVVRAMVVNAAQLASYSQAKDLFKEKAGLKEGVFLHFVASMVSGLVTTIASMPVDILKTRIQNMKVVNGVPEYSGQMDVLRGILRQEGFFALWKGFIPYYSRLGPHTVLTFIILEQMNAAYTRHFVRS